MTVDVVDEAGNHVVWTVELAGVLALSRQGWTKDTVSVGEQLTVTGNPTHTGSPRVFFTRLVLANGTELLNPGTGDVSASRNSGNNAPAREINRSERTGVGES